MSAKGWGTIGGFLAAGGYVWWQEVQIREAKQKIAEIERRAGQLRLQLAEDRANHEREVAHAEARLQTIARERDAARASLARAEALSAEFRAKLAAVEQSRRDGADGEAHPAS